LPINVHMDASDRYDRCDKKKTVPSSNTIHLNHSTGYILLVVLLYRLLSRRKPP